MPIGGAVVSQGRMQHCYPSGYTQSAAIAGGNLGINGGTMAEQIVVPAPMYLDSIRYRNFDTSLTRSIEFGLYRDDGAALAARLAYGTDSFTAAAAQNRTPAFTSAPILISAGVYWIVFRNTGGANNFLTGFQTANATNIGVIGVMSQTLGSALGTTLDMTTGWTRTSNNTFAIVLLGRVFGEAAVF